MAQRRFDRPSNQIGIAQKEIDDLRSKRARVSETIVPVRQSPCTFTLNHDIMHPILDYFRPFSDFWMFRYRDYTYRTLYKLCLVSTQ